MRLLKTLIMVYVLLFAHTSFAEKLIVVANTSSVYNDINKNDVRDIFMRNNSNLDLKPVGLKPENKARLLFNVRIVGLTESRIQSYWAQMRFSGRKKPPKEFDNYDDIIQYLINNKNSVAYLPADVKLPSNLRVIFEA